jgi:hypothetical protein
MRARPAGSAIAVKQLPTLLNVIPALAAWPGHELVAVEDDLRAERRMPRHLDRHVPPDRIHDVERVVVDVFASPLDVDDPARRGPLHLPHRRRRLGRQHLKHPDADLVSGQVRLGEAVFAFTGRTEDDRHPRWLRPRP